MKIYFLSSQPCALTVNGCYFGLCDTFERFAELSFKDENYILFQPQGAGAIGFFLTEEIRFSPPIGCEVYLLADGIAIYAKDFPPIDFTLRVLSQLRRENTLATLYQQGTLQLSIESEFGFFISTLPPSFSSATLNFYEDLLFVEGKNTLAIFSKKGEKLLQENTLSYRVERGELSVQLPLCESLGRIANCTYLLGKDELTRTAFSLSQTRTISNENTAEKLRDELLPFAFFESVRIGADLSPFLCDELLKKADQLMSFLGEFVSVTLTKNPAVCGLVRKKGERLYQVDYFTVEVQDGKIIDVKG